MKNISESQLADELVSAVSDLSSTEELILLVAGRKDMLPLCQKLLEQYDQGESTPLVQLINTLCTAKGTLPGSLYGEVRKVLLALNRFHDTDRNHYEILGLSTDATIDKVKKAYRFLSKKYHPDRTGQDSTGPDKFLEISGAYHSIMASASHQVSSRKISWRKKRSDRNEQKRRAKKKFLATVLILVAVLIVASIFIAERYNSKVIISQLHTNALSIGPANENHGITDKRDVPPALHADSTNTPSQASPENSVSIPFKQPEPATQKPLTVEAILANIHSSNPHPEEVSRSPEKNSDISDESIGTAEVDQFIESKSKPEIRIPSSAAAPTPVPAAENATDQDSSLPTITVPVIVEEGAADQKHDHKKPVENSMAADSSSGITTQAALQETADLHQQDEIHEKEQRIRTINTTLEISALLKEYTKLYNRKDLGPFLALFAEDATENGHALASEIDQYKSLFADTRDINLNIENVSWAEDKNGFLAHGDFVSYYTFQNGSRREYTGDISFLLINEFGTLKIQSLNYVFQ